MSDWFQIAGALLQAGVYLGCLWLVRKSYSERIADLELALAARNQLMGVKEIKAGGNYPMTVGDTLRMECNGPQTTLLTVSSSTIVHVEIV